MKPNIRGKYYLNWDFLLEFHTITHPLHVTKKSRTANQVVG
jgi:hypothetical protein